MTALDQFSLTTVPLEQHFNEQRLGHGTGFVWQTGDKYYLVSNWHVFGMRDFFTGEKIDPKVLSPNIFHTHFNIRIGSFEKQQCRIPIRDEADKPLWLIHPSRRVDIAVLPLQHRPSEQIGTFFPINTLANAALRIEVGMEVFILGYPFKIEPPFYPIWKRGSIASEPQLARLTTDYMFVDTASRPGMSGSPVIRRSWSAHLLEPGRIAQSDTPLDKFVGVYSGRIPTDHPYEAQIGLVWDGSFIDEIIGAGHVDQSADDHSLPPASYRPQTISR